MNDMYKRVDISACKNLSKFTLIVITVIAIMI